MQKVSNKWKSMPKGWDSKSRKEFWESLTGDVKHKVTKCIRQMEDHVDDPGAFCGALKDRIEHGDTSWRGKESMISRIASAWLRKHG